MRQALLDAVLVLGVAAWVSIFTFIMCAVADSQTNAGHLSDS